MSQPPKQPSQTRSGQPRPSANPNRPPPAGIAMPTSMNQVPSAPVSQPSAAKLSQSEFTALLTECEDAIATKKCVVFRVVSNTCSVCRKPDFTAACDALKNKLASNPDVKYYDFEFSRHLTVMGMLDIIEEKVPNFTVFHNGKLVKKYTGPSHMSELEKAITEYTK
jgi:hypothetical protein